MCLHVSPRLLQRLAHRMRFVRAAGGVVEDDDGLVLSILRNGRSGDLPKGRVEEGETLATAALREVEEETGVKAHIVGPRVPMLKTYHIYNLYGGWHLKQTSWFGMHAEGRNIATTPQREEGIEAASWTTKAEWQRRLRAGYATMRTIANTWRWNR